jgi:type II secretory pathway pseudopilin PulG
MKHRTNRSKRNGQALIGLLVVVAIIVATAGIYLSAKGKNPDGSTSTHTALRRSIDLAQEVVLQSNLQQIQMGIGMYKQDNEGKVPASLDDLKKALHYPAEMWINPVDKKPLGYDPTTGRIIVTPYEGESPNIIKMTANPMHGADAPTQGTSAPDASASTPPAAAPSTPGGPKMPKIPTIPNSSADPSAGGDSE